VDTDRLGDAELQAERVDDGHMVDEVEIFGETLEDELKLGQFDSEGWDF